MAGINLEKSRIKVEDLKQGLENKKEVVENLNISKEQLLATRTELEGLNISEESKRTIIATLNEHHEQITKQGEKVSNEIGKDVKELENTMQELQEVERDTEKGLEKLKNKKSILDKINAGGLLDSSISELERDSKQNQEVQGIIIETRKEAEELITRAGML